MINPNNTLSRCAAIQWIEDTGLGIEETNVGDEDEVVDTVVLVVLVDLFLGWVREEMVGMMVVEIQRWDYKIGTFGSLVETGVGIVDEFLLEWVEIVTETRS